MSTKTTFKRIALVAVASLGFGMLSVVPSQAATELFDVTSAEYIATGGETATHVAGPLNYVVISGSAVVAAATGTSYSLSVTGAGATFAGATTGIVVSTTDATKATIADSVALAVGTPTVRVMTPTVGTVTVTVSKNVDTSGITTTTVEDTLTITVNATATVGAVSTAKTTVNTNVGTTAPAAATTADVAILGTKTAGTQVGNIVVWPADANGTVITSATKTLRAVVTGPGTIGIGATTTAPSAGKDVSVSSATPRNISVWADGNAGVASIAIYFDGVLVSTKSVTFFGPSAVLSAVNAANYIKATGSQVTTVTVKDATGNLVAGDALTAVSSNTAVATVAAATATSTTAGLSTWTVTGVAAGTATITFTNAAGTVTTTSVVNVSGEAATTVALSFDKSEYAPGEKMTITVTAKDSTGAAVADTTAATGLFAAGGISSSIALNGDVLTATNPALVDGKKTYTVYAPLVSGPVTISATTGVTGTFVAAAGAGLTVTAVTTVLSDGVAQAAADAAAEATDAANAATDAANAAAEAADAATAAAQDAADAVAALSTQVADMINALKKQITALTNLVIKIQKKVKA